MSTEEVNQKNAKHKFDVLYKVWIRIGHENITFSDELDFDITELDVVYKDNEVEGQ